MANLVKIKEVYLYTSNKLGDGVTADCEAAKALLTNAGIKFNELWYNDPNIDENAPVLTSLSTWHWGPNGEKGQRQMTSFPILHWTECMDDWSSHREHAHGLSEIKAATLLQNASLTEK